MCTITGAVERILDGLTELASMDVSMLADQQVRDELLSLTRAAHQVRAAVLARVAAFDARGLASDDGFRTTTGWLGGFAHVGRYAAHGMVKTGRVLRELPALAAAAGRGDVSEDHVGKVVKLANDIGVVAVKDFDTILADLAAATLPADVGVACNRIRAYVDPDGPEPDPAADFEQRGVHLTPIDGGVLLKGRLDLEAGASLMTALDALTRPPTGDDQRTAIQRRADALADLARGALASGGLPTVGGVRPQIGILIPAETSSDQAGRSSCRKQQLPTPARPSCRKQRRRRTRSPPPASHASPSPAGWTGTARSPLNSPAGSPATATSGASCSTPPTDYHWNWVAPTAPHPTGSAKRCTPGIAAVAGRAVPSLHNGQTHITGTTGSMVASPMWTRC